MEQGPRGGISVGLKQPTCFSPRSREKNVDYGKSLCSGVARSYESGGPAKPAVRSILREQTSSVRLSHVAPQPFRKHNRNVSRPAASAMARCEVPCSILG
jgi:hypothetical protein